MRSTPAQSSKKTVKNSSTASTAKETFAIVAVGASAGGIEAISELLSALTATTGMAFIYAQRHAPGSTGKLMELLSYNTKMEVREVQYIYYR